MKVLIEFFDSDEPILNLLSCLALKPDICVYIGDERIRRQRSRRSLQNTLKIAGTETLLRFEPVNVFDFNELCASLKRILAEYCDMQCIMDVSGGSDLLLLAAGMCCADHSLEVVCHKPGSNYLSFLYGRRAGQRQTYDIRLTPEQTLAMANGALLRHGHVEPDELTEDILAVIPDIFRVYSVHRERWPQFVQYLQQTNDPMYWQFDETDIRAPKKLYCGRTPVFGDLQILSDLADVGAVRDIRINSSEYAFCYTSVKLGEYLRDVGIWLELYLYSVMLKTGLFDYVDVNAVVSWDDTDDDYDTINEIDLLASAGIGRMFISCKTGVPDNAALNEIATVARRFGGRYSIPVLATMCDLKSNAPAVFRRAVEMGIAVLDADDLKDEVLIKKFKTLCARWDQ